MIEPTESESKEELDRFCDALIAIREEIREIESGRADREQNLLTNAPHTLEQVIADGWTRPYPRERAAYPSRSVREHKVWPTVGRIDSAYGDRNLVCTCPRWMPMASEWRLWIDRTPRPGWANMAIDQTLLERASAGERWLRLYGWEPSCLSFGRHEPAARRYDAGRIAALGMDVVRRPTGGRAVWHARELTYTVACPGGLGSLRESYLEIHAMLRDALHSLGVPAEPRAAGPGGKGGRRGVLCPAGRRRDHGGGAEGGGECTAQTGRCPAPARIDPPRRRSDHGRRGHPGRCAARPCRTVVFDGGGRHRQGGPDRRCHGRRDGALARRLARVERARAGVAAGGAARTTVPFTGMDLGSLMTRRPRGLALLALLATTAPLHGQTDPRSTVVIVTGGQATMPIPTLMEGPAANTANLEVADHLFLRLANLGPEVITSGDNAFVPLLAKSWTRRDSVTLAFDLDPRATWQDGVPVTARDVLFTFERARNPEIAPRLAKLLRRVVSVTAEGDRCVVFRFSEPYAEQLYDAVWHAAPLRPIFSRPFRRRSWTNPRS